MILKKKTEQEINSHWLRLVSSHDYLAFRSLFFVHVFFVSDFHAQQAIEKIGKALIGFRSNENTKKFNHNLSKILARVEELYDVDIMSKFTIIKYLTSNFSGLRYIEESKMPSEVNRPDDFMDQVDSLYFTLEELFELDEASRHCSGIYNTYLVTTRTNPLKQVYLEKDNKALMDRKESMINLFKEAVSNGLIQNTLNEDLLKNSFF